MSHPLREQREMRPLRAESPFTPEEERIVESIALQHNSELKCAIQLLTPADELMSELEIKHLFSRIPELGVGKSRGDSIKHHIDNCFIPNGTLERISAATIIKPPRPAEDALAGYMLSLSATSDYSLTELFGKTSVTGGHRRPSFFRLGVLQALAESEGDGVFTLGELANYLRTSKATVYSHATSLHNSGVISYAATEPNGLGETDWDFGNSRGSSAISLNPRQSELVRSIVDNVKGTASQDEQIVAEGIRLGHNIVTDTVLLKRLLQKEAAHSPQRHKRPLEETATKIATLLVSHAELSTAEIRQQVDEGRLSADGIRAALKLLKSKGEIKVARKSGPRKYWSAV